MSALENDRSINAEISARLERSFELSDDERETAIRLLSELSNVLRKDR